MEHEKEDVHEIHILITLKVYVTLTHLCQEGKVTARCSQIFQNESQVKA